MDIISSSAHQRGEDFGVAPSGPIPVISFNLAATSLIVGLFSGSGCKHCFINSHLCFENNQMTFRLLTKLFTDLQSYSREFTEYLRVLWDISGDCAQARLL